MKSPEQLHSEETVAQTPTYGLLMIKPNAMKVVLDPSIISIFDGAVPSVFQNEQCNFIADLDRVSICGRYYRNLSKVPYYEQLIALFYGDKKTKRYFSMISEFYHGEVVFLLLKYNGTNEQMKDFMTRVKGEAETFDVSGQQVSKPKGIRGVLSAPYLYYSAEASNDLDDKEYRHAFSPVVQNFIHVCDTPKETAMALNLLLTNYDLEDLKNREHGFIEFVENNLVKSN